MKAEARILVLGDDNVGKTSIIAALVEEKFVEEVPLVMSEVFIPPEIVPDRIPMYIMDTSNRMENKVTLEADIRRHDSIVLVYDVSNPNSFDRLKTYWLPYLASLQLNHKPIILVGNKIDTRGDNVVNAELEENMVPLMNEYTNIETCVECSSKLNMNITDIFLYALKFAIYPTFPIFDVVETALKPNCIVALTRIFTIFDKNNDGFLDDQEINHFQMACFESSLKEDELENVKSIIKDFDPEGVTPRGVNLSGFLSLHLLFIQRGRLETTWKALRKFGYNDHCELDDLYLHPRFDISPDCNVELSGKACQLIVEIFKKYDKDLDGALNPDELDDMFAITKEGCHPWSGYQFPHCTQTNERGWVTLSGFIAQWHLMTLLDARETIALLAYFGFEDPIGQGMKISRPRGVDRLKGSNSRSVLHGLVIGAPATGKNTLLRRFLQKSDNIQKMPVTDVKYAIRAVDVGSSSKYLLLERVSPQQVRSRLYDHRGEDLARTVDVLALCYDASDANSFAYIASLCKDLKFDTIPVVLIATKCDLDIAKQRYPIQPEEFCRQRHWISSKEISLIKESSAPNTLESICVTLVDVALHPNLSMTHQIQSSLRKWIWVVTLTGSLVATSYAALRLYRHYKLLHRGDAAAH